MIGGIGGFGGMLSVVEVRRTVSVNTSVMTPGPSGGPVVEILPVVLPEVEVAGFPVVDDMPVVDMSAVEEDVLSVVDDLPVVDV